jgi:prophage antirepressor-like protein
MRYIEQGIDKDGVQIWFVLEDADLIGMYYTEQEAKDQL